MATRLLGAKLNLLSAREVLNAQDRELSDGGGLLLRRVGANAAWVFRYTSPTGKRREMGLGACARHNASAAGESLALARDLAAKQRALLASDPPCDPIDERDRARAAGKPVSTACVRVARESLSRSPPRAGFLVSRLRRISEIVSTTRDSTSRFVAPGLTLPKSALIDHHQLEVLTPEVHAVVVDRVCAGPAAPIGAVGPWREVCERSNVSALRIARVEKSYKTH